MLAGDDPKNPPPIGLVAMPLNTRALDGCKGRSRCVLGCTIGDLALPARLAASRAAPAGMQTEKEGAVDGTAFASQLIWNRWPCQGKETPCGDNGYQLVA